MTQIELKLAAEEAKKVEKKYNKLRKLINKLEENNKLSPSLVTVIFNAKNAMMAYDAASIYEHVSGQDLPVPLDDWIKTIEKFPVELYFVFKKTNHLRKFMKEMTIEYPDDVLTFKF